MPSISSFQLSEEKTDYVSPFSQYGIPYFYSSLPLLNSGGDRKCLRCAIRQTPDIFETVSGPPRSYPDSPPSVTIPDIPPLPPVSPIYFSIIWATTFYGTNDGDPWLITRGGNSIRFSIEDSGNCGGSNDNVQGGTAIATIQTGSQAVQFDLTFDGLAELQDSGYENIEFLLDSVLLATATSQDLDQGCDMGPVTSTFFVSFPMLLAANTTYVLEINFTTGDALYHVDGYYQIDLNFSPV
jgi:hypothetical protein